MHSPASYRSSYWERGFGKKLMEAATEKARIKGCHHLLLTTYSYQGVQFYPKVGFKQLAKISNYPIRGIDILYFIKYLIAETLD